MARQWQKRASMLRRCSHETQPEAAAFLSFASLRAKVISLENRSIFGWNLRRPGILQHAFSTQPKSCGRWSSSTYSMAVHAATMSVLMMEDDVYAALQPFARCGARVACGAEKQVGRHAQIEHAAADGEEGFVGKQGCEHGEDASAHRHALAVEIYERQSAAAYCGGSDGGGELAEHVMRKLCESESLRWQR